MGDVGERTAVHEGEVAFDGLDEIRLDGVLEERDEGAAHAEFLNRDGGTVAARADDDAVDAGAQVVKVRGEAKDGHEFGGGRDVEARFRRDAVGGAAETRDDVAEHAVVHVHDAAPEDFLELDLTLVAGVVDQSGEEVVGGGDGVEVAREVQVDGFHRKDLRVAAAGSAALHAEDRAEGRFAKGEYGLLAELLETLGEGDRRGGLAGACGHAGRGRHEDELGRVGTGGVELDLGFVAAVRLELGVGEAGLVGKLVNRNELGCLSNFNIAEHGISQKGKCLKKLKTDGLRHGPGASGARP